MLLRKCTENYKIPETDVVIKKGTSVVIPVMGLHTDSKYFEKPDDFYPEHFTAEAKQKRHHFSYLPFGEGPRICIGENNLLLNLMNCYFLDEDIGVIKILNRFEYS